MWHGNCLNNKLVRVQKLQVRQVEKHINAKIILILSTDEKECDDLGKVLKTGGYQLIAARTLLDIEHYFHKHQCRLAFLDLDSVPLDNRTIRQVTRENPGLYLLAVSRELYHPELKDSIGCHIYACINRPMDPDEVFYLIESIYREEADPNCQS